LTADRPRPAARLPLRVTAAVAALAAVLLTLALGFTDGARLVLPAAPAVPSPAAPAHPAPAHPSAVPDPAVPVAAIDSSGTHPYTDDAYAAARALLVRPQRDAGERTVPAGPLLFAPPYTPRVPPRPARPAPVSGHAPAGTAHVPSDLGRAPPTSSST
jgi:hypothetical protein